jgi:hypothetical protein
MSLFSVRLPVLLVALVTACASHTSRARTAPSPPAPAGAVVEVDNQSAYDMDVYVLGEGGRIRLGFAPSNEKTKLPIAPGLIAGSGLIRFEGRPSPTGQRVVSDPFRVDRGDELNWTIPPQ